ncbi:MAG: hypothetical protein AAF801_15340 [Pseudomonadota bacterium]
MSRLTQATVGVLPSLTILICLGLAGWMWLPFNRDMTATPRPPQASAANSASQRAGILEAGAQQLAERPLFHMSRRPHVEAEVAPAAPVEVTLSLTGVLDSDDVQIALLRLSNSPDLLRRRVGETVGDWRIVDITNTSITVVATSGEEQIIGLSSTSP